MKKSTGSDDDTGAREEEGRQAKKTVDEEHVGAEEEGSDGGWRSGRGRMRLGLVSLSPSPRKLQSLQQCNLRALETCCCTAVCWCTARQL